MSGKEKEHSSHFLTGVAVGAAITALFTTKTGRRLLHELTTHGADFVEGKVDLEKIVDRVKNAGDEDEGEIDVGSTAPRRKRVFKGARKK